MRALLFSTCFLFLISCGNEQIEQAQGNWIKGSEQEKLEIIEGQFGGFSQAMVEIGYRYQELYWAGKDENWEYADYQLEHIEEALEAGLERRPKRAQSAEHFITYTIPEMEKAIESKDTLVFNKSFKQLKVDCRKCHIAERHGFIEVSIPKLRVSPVIFEN